MTCLRRLRHAKLSMACLRRLRHAVKQSTPTYTSKHALHRSKCFISNLSFPSKTARFAGAKGVSHIILRHRKSPSSNGVAVSGWWK